MNDNLGLSDSIPSAMLAEKRKQPLPEEQYRFLKNLNLKIITNPQEGRGYAETWPANETGAPDYPRPKDIPLNQHGIEIYKPDRFSVHDIAGEGLHIDPVAARVRALITPTLTPEQQRILTKQPDYAMGDLPVQRRMQNATDAAMRGYLVNQWPADEARNFWNEEQLKHLDQLKEYMVTGVHPDQNIPMEAVMRNAPLTSQ